MNLTSTFTIILSAGEIADMLKQKFPNDVRIAALPSNGKALWITAFQGGVKMEHERRVNATEEVVRLQRANEGEAE